MPWEDIVAVASRSEKIRTTVLATGPVLRAAKE
jgi:hypothetical protein